MSIEIRKVGKNYVVLKRETKVYILTAEGKWEERHGGEKIGIPETIETAKEDQTI